MDDLLPGDHCDHPGIQEADQNAFPGRKAGARPDHPGADLFASTLCAMTETGFSSPGLDVPQRASQSIRNIRDCLDQPGYVPKNEVDELRGLLRKLEIRIELIAEELPENGYQRRA